MSDFKGWKRKLGIVTLLMACSLMGGWFRSLQICDVVNIPLGKGNSLTISSVCSSLVFRVGWIGSNPWDEFDWLKMEVRSLNDQDRFGFHDLTEWPFPTGEGDIVTWKVVGFGAGVGHSSRHDPYQRSCCYFIIPYWLTIFPMIALSSWLLVGRSFIAKSNLPPDSGCENNKSL